MGEIKKQIEELLATIDDLSDKLHLPDKQRSAKELEALTLDPGFWQDEAKAREISKHLANIQAEIDEVQAFRQEVQESLDLLAMAKVEDTEIRQDLETALLGHQKKLTKLQIKLFLTGPYDGGNAIVAIHAGQGGTEACDWAAMLKRMYTRYFERHDYKFELIEESVGEDAGIKSVTYLVTGQNAYGYLKGEAGTHRLVRQSPFNADNLRQTSFALVEVLPEVPETDAVTIRDDELEWQFFRSGGKGGQNVNKVNTAVRLRHLPTNLVVESQAQRYQEQNRKMALSILQAKLWQIKEKKRQQELASLRGTKMASWGSQIRNYVLHPYHLVKDVRTGVEIADTEKVLDGELDQFIEAELTQAV